MMRRAPRMLEPRTPPPPSLLPEARLLLTTLRAGGFALALDDQRRVVCPGARAAGFGDRIAALRPELIALLTLEQLQRR